MALSKVTGSRAFPTTTSLAPSSLSSSVLSYKFNARTSIPLAANLGISHLPLLPYAEVTKILKK
jgi:hypothetical protein